MRLGIFGGSFDPPHIGHLLAAVDAFESLSLDKLFFVPTSVQPLKAGMTSAAAHQRLAMVRLLVGADQRFAVDSVEIDRAGLSYTVDTLETFAQRFPNAERFFLIGEDAMTAFGAWRKPEQILRLAKLAILRRQRAGSGSESERGRETLGAAADPDTILPAGTIALPTRLVNVSSTEIRERIRRGRSIHGFVPESVAAFIETERLYR
ncbi:MAG TPA: nicotinate (nicotinamide) nucleotide adenylyltransferase [Gemmatimonadaceae bacterium]|nr:nicotinate (nicotinamide) nucleotide adenylyltransferase [Gemmatimonadaceae bacterium]